jgi:hypothetical protein
MRLRTPQCTEMREQWVPGVVKTGPVRNSGGQQAPNHKYFMGREIFGGIKVGDYILILTPQLDHRVAVVEKEGRIFPVRRLINNCF